MKNEFPSEESSGSDGTKERKATKLVLLQEKSEETSIVVYNQCNQKIHGISDDVIN